MQHQIKNIKEKLATLKALDKNFKVFGAKEHQYILNKILTEHEIKNIEKQYNITLPKEYRFFLKEIGDGGAGPYYGLHSFTEALGWVGKEVNHPFPLEKSWLCNPKKLTEYGDYYTKEFLVESYGKNYMQYIYIPENDKMGQGVIALADQGCGYCSFLVITGKAKGKVWNDYSAGDGLMENTNKTFLDWYEEWLDKELEKINDEIKQIKRLQKQVQVEPSNGNLYYEIGNIYNSVLGDGKKAISFFTKALSTNKLNLTYIYNIYIILYKKENYDIIQQYVSKVIRRISKKNEKNTYSIKKIYKLIGETYFEVKKFKLAIKYLQLTLKYTEFPNDYHLLEETYRFLARSYIELEKYQEALNALNKMQEKNAWRFSLYGIAYVGLNLFEEGIQAYQKSIRLAPDWITPLDNMGCAYALMGKYTKAIKIHQKVIQKDPDYAWAHYNMATAYALQNKLAEALPYFERAIVLGYDKELIKKDKYIKNLRSSSAYKKLILSK